MRQQRRVHLVAGEVPQPLLALRLLAHARPDVGVDHVGVGDARGAGRRSAISSPSRHLSAEGLQERLVEAVAVRRRQDEADAELAAADRQRPGHVVAVADEDDRPPRSRRRTLPES